MRRQNASTSVSAASTTWSLVGASSPSRPVSGAMGSSISSSRSSDGSSSSPSKSSPAGCSVASVAHAASRANASRNVSVGASGAAHGGSSHPAVGTGDATGSFTGWTRRPTPALVRSRPATRAAFETDVVLADGATAHVRPIRPDDAPRLAAFHERQSPESIYFRYFSPRPRLTERDLERLTHVDYVDRFALVVLRGDDLIGVARYDRWRHRAEAEVAFFVDDANHGRGLATLLLEHLAVRAREVGLRGLHRVGAPRQPAMIGVFTQAGFETATRFADGVIEVRLDLQPTPEAEAAIEARARTAAAEAVRRLLSPRSVAVIGAGRDPGSLGHRVLRELQLRPLRRTGVAGEPERPRRGEHPGGAAASSTSTRRSTSRSSPCRPPTVAGGGGGVRPQAGVRRRGPVGGLRRVRPRGRGAGGRGAADGPLVGHPGGRAELPRAHQHRRRRCGSTPPSSTSPPAAAGCRCCRSPGMLGAVLVTAAHEAGLGLSSFLALGNRADVSGNDLLQYWEADDTTDVVGMYIESFGNPRNFSRLARRLTRAKPVIAVKARSARRRRRPAGDATEDALLRQTGVVRVPTLDALVDTARLLLTQPLPAGRRVAVLGNAGGSLAIAADAALTARPRAGRPGAVDPRGGRRAAGARRRARHRRPRTPRRAPTTWSAPPPPSSPIPGVDALLVLYAEGLGATTDEAVAAVARRAQGPPRGAGGRLRLRAAPHPVGRRARCTTPSTRRPARSAGWPPTPSGAPSPRARCRRSTTSRPAAARRPRAGAPRRGRTALGDVEAHGAARRRRASRCCAPRWPPTSTRRRWPPRSIGFPVVLKAAGRAPTAKTAAAGFAIDLEGPDALGARVGADGRGPRRRPHPGARAADGRRRASTWRSPCATTPPSGPVLSLGLGGAAAALDPPTDVRVLPLTDLDAARLVAGSRLAPALDDADRAALEAALLPGGGADRGGARGARAHHQPADRPRRGRRWSPRPGPRSARSSATRCPPVRRA